HVRTRSTCLLISYPVISISPSLLSLAYLFLISLISSLVLSLQVEGGVGGRRAARAGGSTPTPVACGGSRPGGVWAGSVGGRGVARAGGPTSAPVARAGGTAIPRQRWPGPDGRRLVWGRPRMATGVRGWGAACCGGPVAAARQGRARRRRLHRFGEEIKPQEEEFQA
ncbi:unnamed protein product, partial [Urochloa humidicola]